MQTFFSVFTLEFDVLYIYITKFKYIWTLAMYTHVSKYCFKTMLLKMRIYLNFDDKISLISVLGVCPTLLITHQVKCGTHKYFFHRKAKCTLGKNQFLSIV